MPIHPNDPDSKTQRPDQEVPTDEQTEQAYEDRRIDEGIKRMADSAEKPLVVLGSGWESVGTSNDDDSAESVDKEWLADRAAAMAIVKTISDRAECEALAMSEGLTMAHMADMVTPGLVTDHVLEAIRARVNGKVLGSLIGNLWDSTDQDILSDGEVESADEWRAKYTEMYKRAFDV